MSLHTINGCLSWCCFRVPAVAVVAQPGKMQGWARCVSATMSTIQRKHFVHGTARVHLDQPGASNENATCVLLHLMHA